MIQTYKCTFGVLLPLNLSERFGPRVEIEALEFIGGAPIEWRIDSGMWRPGLKGGNEQLRGFHDLQFPVTVGTRGIQAAEAVIDTRGIGDATVMVWLREGTYSERKTSSEILPILQPKTASSLDAEGCEVLA